MSGIGSSLRTTIRVTARYACELANLYPTTALPDGKTPRQKLLESLKVANPIPDLYAVHRFGAPGGLQRRVQAEKFEPRAVKAYYVERDGSRIYYMYVPETNKVIRTSSVAWPTANAKPIDEPPELPIPISHEPTRTNRTSATEPESENMATEPEPENTAPEPEEDTTAVEEAEQEIPEMGKGYRFDSAEPLSHETAVNNVEQPHESPRHLEIAADLDDRLILHGPRLRTKSHRARLAIAVPLSVARCFAAAINSSPTVCPNNSTLPPEPTSHKQALHHLYAKGWLAAEAEEYSSHDENGTWLTTATYPAGEFPLPTKWVYKYKLDNGKLARLKVRLVVCGNRQQADFWRETYAAVARSTTLKVLLALVAALDLECDQLDVVTAFLNGTLDADEEVYVRLPDGRIAKLRKALYGLRRSPRLWYEELSRFLLTIGLSPIEANPCVFIDSDGCIILAYVDDIIIIARNKALLATLKAKLTARYKCRDMGPISLYLGIRINRDRQHGRMELSMEAYVNKLAADYNRTSQGRQTPLDTRVLKLKAREANDQCEPQLLQRYQSLIGKVLYPAAQLRTDVAFHVAYLARFMSNPTEAHYEYALQIVDYLYTYKELVMTYQKPENGKKLSLDMFSTTTEPLHDGLGLHGYSDAAFADSNDHKSTSGYLFKFAGGTD